MCRRCTELPEIIGGPDDPTSEVVLPDTIDHHACCQRVLRTRHPFREDPPFPRRFLRPLEQFGISTAAGFRTVGNAGFTSRPMRCGLPRRRICVGVCSPSEIAKARWS